MNTNSTFHRFICVRYVCELAHQEIPSVLPAKEPKKLSRRDFLKLSLAAAVTAPFAVAEFEKAIIKAFSSGLSLPGATDCAVSMANKVAEVSNTPENQGFRPVHEIINEGVTNFEKNTGKKAFYQRSKDYKEYDYYKRILDKMSASIILPQTPGDILEKFKDYLPYEAQQAYFSSDLRITSFPEVFAEGSGLYERFKKIHPDFFNDRGQIVNYDKYFAAAEVEAQTEIIETKEFVERTRTKSGNPISSSNLLEYYLGKNDGDLARSVYDTAIFLKFMARSDLQTASASYTPSTVRWFQENINDEYQGPSYLDHGDDKTLINLVGKPYHSWNLVALTAFFPVEFVHAAGVYRQLATMRDQGIDKTKADLQTLQDLRQTEQILLSRSHADTK